MKQLKFIERNKELQIIVFDGLWMLYQVWDRVIEKIIKNCFCYVNFVSVVINEYVDFFDSDEEDLEDDIFLVVFCFCVLFDDYVQIDEIVIMIEVVLDKDIVDNIIVVRYKEVEEDEEEEVLEFMELLKKKFILQKVDVVFEVI